MTFTVQMRKYWGSRGFVLPCTEPRPILAPLKGSQSPEVLEIDSSWSTEINNSSSLLAMVVPAPYSSEANWERCPSFCQAIEGYGAAHHLHGRIYFGPTRMTLVQLHLLVQHYRFVRAAERDKDLLNICQSERDNLQGEAKLLNNRCGRKWLSVKRLPLHEWAFWLFAVDKEGVMSGSLPVPLRAIPLHSIYICECRCPSTSYNSHLTHAVPMYTRSRLSVPFHIKQEGHDVGRLEPLADHEKHGHQAPHHVPQERLSTHLAGTQTTECTTHQSSGYSGRGMKHYDSQATGASPTGCHEGVPRL